LKIGKNQHLVKLRQTKTLFGGLLFQVQCILVNAVSLRPTSEMIGGFLNSFGRQRFAVYVHLKFAAWQLSWSRADSIKHVQTSTEKNTFLVFTTSTPKCRAY